MAIMVRIAESVNQSMLEMSKTLKEQFEQPVDLQQLSENLDVLLENDKRLTALSKKPVKVFPGQRVYVSDSDNTLWGHYGEIDHISSTFVSVSFNQHGISTRGTFQKNEIQVIPPLFSVGNKALVIDPDTIMFGKEGIVKAVGLNAVELSFGSTGADYSPMQLKLLLKVAHGAGCGWESCTFCQARNTVTDANQLEIPKLVDGSENS